MEDTGRDDEETGDPARAFDDLRAEISVLRRAVEALPAALEDNRAPDYSPDLGRIVQGLSHVGATLGVIEKHSALRLTPEQHQAAIARAGEGLLREAVQKLEHAAHEAHRARQQLGGMIGTIREQNAQWNWVFFTGLAACVAGLLLSPVLAGALPFGLDGRVAALIMKDSDIILGVFDHLASGTANWPAFDFSDESFQLVDLAKIAVGASQITYGTVDERPAIWIG